MTAQELIDLLREHPDWAVRFTVMDEDGEAVEDVEVTRAREAQGVGHLGTPYWVVD